MTLTPKCNFSSLVSSSKLSTTQTQNLLKNRLKRILTNKFSIYLDNQITAECQLSKTNNNNNSNINHSYYNNSKLISLKSYLMPSKSPERIQSNIQHQWSVQAVTK